MLKKLRKDQMPKLTKNTPLTFHFRYFGNYSYAKSTTGSEIPNQNGGITIMFNPEHKCFAVSVCARIDGWDRKDGNKKVAKKMKAWTEGRVSRSVLYSDVTALVCPFINEWGKSMNPLNRPSTRHTPMTYMVTCYNGDMTMEDVKTAAANIATAYSELFNVRDMFKKGLPAVFSRRS